MGGSHMRFYQPMFPVAAVVFVIAAVVLTPEATAGDYDVTIDTASLTGTDATLAFDFVAGGTSNNTVAISDFATSGALTSSGPRSGSATGTLPGTVSLSTSSFFNEYLQGLTLGSTISFQFDITGQAPSGGVPDTFSFYLLNSSGGSSLVATSDPAGADSLFSLQIDGSQGGALGVYTATPQVLTTVVPAGTATGVPEPGILGLMILGLLAGWGSRRIRTQASQVGLV
jgi:hypothetical protein